MSQSDSIDGLHLAAPTLCIQMSQEGLREGRQGGRKGGRQRKRRESFRRQLVMCSCQGGWITPQSLPSEGEARGRKKKSERKRNK